MKKMMAAGLAAALLAMTGCASIISGSTQTLTFKSVPEEAGITITDRAGEKVHTGVTPVTLTLKRGSGYFKPAAYDVAFNKEGFQSKTVKVTGKMNGWYIGNLLFGGIIGLLIVDPATGAMYTLNPSDIHAVLDENKQASHQSGQQSLTVMLIQDIPEEMMKRAEPIAAL